MAGAYFENVEGIGPEPLTSADTMDETKKGAIQFAMKAMRSPLTWIIVLAAVLRLHRVAALAVHVDEASAYWIARSSIGNIYFLLSDHMHGAPPISYVLAHASLALSDSTLFFRLPSVVAGVVGVACLFGLGRWVGGNVTGYWAAALLAVSPLHIYHSQEARMYALMCLFSVVSLIFFLKAEREDRIRDWILLTISNIVLVYVHLFGSLLILAEFICMLVGPTRTLLSRGGDPNAWRKIRRLAVAGLTMCLAIIPLIPILMRPKFPGFFGGPDLDFAYFRGVSQAFSTGGNRLAWIYVALLGIGFVVGAFRWKEKAWYLLVCMFVPLVGVNLFLQGTSYFAPKYVIMTLPIFLLFVATGITFVTERVNAFCFRENGKTLVALSIACWGLISLMNIPLLVRYYSDGNFWGNPGRNPWAECVEFVSENAAPADAIGFYQGYGQYAYDYYDRGSDFKKVFFVSRNSVGKMEERSELLGRKYDYLPLGVYPEYNPNTEKVKSTVEQYRRMWMVYSSPYPKEGTLFLKDMLGGSYTALLEKKFGNGIELLLYEIQENPNPTAASDLLREDAPISM